MSKQVSREAEEVTSFFQGLLAGMVMKEATGGTFPLKVDHIDSPKDARGDYRDHFIVVTESGIRMKVRVTVE